MDRRWKGTGNVLVQPGDRDRRTQSCRMVKPRVAGGLASGMATWSLDMRAQFALGDRFEKGG